MRMNSEDCLNHLIKTIQDDQFLIRNQITTLDRRSIDMLNQTLMPASIDPTAWTRISTRRPMLEKEQTPRAGLGNILGGGAGGGTDLEIRTYENDVWIDAGGKLTAEVKTLFGEFIEVVISAHW